jgi:hypothetical protein
MADEHAIDREFAAHPDDPAEAGEHPEPWWVARTRARSPAILAAHLTPGSGG